MESKEYLLSLLQEAAAKLGQGSVNVSKKAVKGVSSKLPQAIENQIIQILHKRKARKYVKQLEMFSKGKLRNSPELSQLAQLAMKAKISPKELVDLLNKPESGQIIRTLLKGEAFDKLEDYLKHQKKRIRP